MNLSKMSSFKIEKDALWRQVIRGEIWMCIGGGGGGLPDLLIVHMVLVYGKISVGDSLLFHAIFCMILVTGLG